MVTPKLLLALVLYGLMLPNPIIMQQKITDDKNVVCFIYHRFGDARYPSTNITTQDFEAHLRYLVEHQFQVLTLSEALAYVQSDRPIKKTVVITIDDGYKSFFLNGLPLLKKYKLPATLFINTETVGASDFMTWEQLSETMNAHIEIGNHTHSHAYFLNESASTRYKTLENEIRQSQSLITEKLNITPTLFSYPFGEFDEAMKEIVKKAGFAGAAAQKSGVLYTETDRLEIPRFPMSENYAALEKFSEKASMRPLQVSYQSPGNSILLPDEKRPILTLTFARDQLQLNNLQCFAQGGGCTFKILSVNESDVTLQIQSTHSISSRRRTIYTVTVPDKSGSWHWFSHLWINPVVKGN